jgi:sarcosine oxidase gamma subunit
MVLLLVLGGSGYYVRRSQLRTQAAASVSSTSPLGDLSVFRKIAEDMLSCVRAGDLSGAKSLANDLETAWDNAQARLKAMNPDKWTVMDNAVDDVLTKVRATQPNGAESSVSLESFISVIDTLGNQKSQSQTQAPSSVATKKPLGDLSAFRKIAEDMLRLVRAGDMSGAKLRADDLETAWDNAQARLRAMNPDKWTVMDSAIDDALKKIRATQPKGAESGASLESLIAVINTLDNQK